MKRIARLNLCLSICLMMTGVSVGRGGPLHESPLPGESSSDPDTGFAIYFVQEQTPVQELLKAPLDEIELESEPWLAACDIEFYDYSSHCIYLKKPVLEYLELENVFDMSMNPRFGPFVVIAGGQRCYLGAFHSLLSSTMYRLPTISEGNLSHGPPEMLSISFAWGDTDPRSHSEIERVLRDLDLYRGGLAFTLDSLRVLENTDEGATVEYRCTVTSRDLDGLYVLDAPLMGDRFYQFVPGLMLHRRPEPSLRLVPLEKPQLELQLDVARQYVLLPAGESLEWNLTLRTNPIPPAEYRCQAGFANGGPDDQPRQRPDGRIWFGRIRSNELEITVAE